MASNISFEQRRDTKIEKNNYMDGICMHYNFSIILSDCFDSKSKSWRTRSRNLSFKCLLNEYIYQKLIIKQRNSSCLIIVWLKIIYFQIWRTTKCNCLWLATNCGTKKNIKFKRNCTYKQIGIIFCDHMYFYISNWKNKDVY